MARTKQINRISVVGSPGAGKTTFALELQKKTKLPLVHSDYFFLDPEKDYLHNRETWKKFSLTLNKPKKWIIDGNDGSVILERFEAADLVIFLDIPLIICYWGVLKRRFKYHKKSRPGMHPQWQETLNWTFLKYIYRWHTIHKSRITTALHETSTDSVILKSHKQAEIFLENF